MPTKALWRVTTRAMWGWWNDNCLRLAASLAFYTVLSLAPLVIIVVGVAGLVAERQQVAWALATQSAYLMGTAGRQVVDTIVATTEPQGGTLAALVGLLTLVLGATAVFGELEAALNLIWEVQPKPLRGVGTALWDRLKQRTLSHVMVLAIAFLLLVSLVVSSQIDDLDDAIDRVSAVITRHLAAEHEAITLLDSIPGVSQRTAEILLAAIGTDMTCFPRAKPLASWAGMCPGHDDSGGKRLSGKTRKGSRWLRQTLVEVAHVASKTRQTHLAAHYRRIAARRGKKRALMAVGHTILRFVNTLLTRKQSYRDLGATYVDPLDQQRVERRLVQGLERLSYQVSLQPHVA